MRPICKQCLIRPVSTTKASFCSKTCSNRWILAHRKAPQDKKQPCIKCNQEYVARWQDTQKKVCPNCRKLIDGEHRSRKWEEQKKKQAERVILDRECLHCGARHAGQYGSGKFCSSKCSHTRKHTEEEQRKRRESLFRFYAGRTKATVGKPINPTAPFSKQEIERLCVVCNQPYSVLWKKRKKHLRTCSRVCMDKDPIILASRRRAGKANKGKPKPKDFKGSWERHPRKSWGEQIAAELLVKNNVPFQDEKQVGKYWLDFFIEIKGIKYDVEIDGVQHTREEFIEHDRERDIFIKSRGYTVYRFPWSKNNIQIFRESFEHFINASFV